MENYGIKERDIAVSIILTIITCGIYGIYWYISITNEVGKLSRDSRLNGALCFLLTIVTCGFYGIYWAYLMGKAIYNIKQERNITNNNDNSIVYLILQLFGFGIIVYVLSQNEINEIVKA